jgi:hypothetical protein
MLSFQGKKKCVDTIAYRDAVVLDGGFFLPKVAFLAECGKRGYSTQKDVWYNKGIRPPT